MKQNIGIALMTVPVMIGLGGGVVEHNPYWTAFYGLMFIGGALLSLLR